MQFVWNEALGQAREMLQTWISNVEPGIQSYAQGTRMLSLNVLAATGFCQSYKFRSSNQPETKEVRTYRDALEIVLDNALLLMIVPPRMLLLPLLPKAWARIGKSAADFKRYMMHMLDEETSLLHQGKPGTGSLMTSLVRALDTQQKEVPSASNISGQPPSKGLTVEEIYGNIFVINFAGHLSTASTLPFSMLLLAANPQIQDWVAEEVQEVTSKRDIEEWDYSETFSDLKRCQAVLMRILYLNTILETYIHSSRRSASIHRYWHFPNGLIGIHKSSGLAKRQL